ncbi:MAG: hypothetical protein LKJ83_07955 [Eubacteriaceae bacterium]|jgi:4-hydroxybutyrate CoA-transferase|nr:hypothetical protein [Eubacteriaceae bacterium]
MIIGIKYCGGCNPRYDRTGAVRSLASAMPYAEFRPAAGKEDYIIIVCGCPAECADHSALTAGRGKIIVHDKEKAAEIKEQIEIRERKKR